MTPLEHDDASRLAGVNGSRKYCDDASRSTSGDVSGLAARDASPVADGDPSRRTSGDASRAQRGDASPIQRGDASALEEPRRVCAWCGGSLDGLRVDAVHCGKRCRQAAWRFGRHVKRLEVAEQPCRLAYADPPYPGLSGYYAEHPDYDGEVDHAALVSSLQRYDGWALSTSSDAVFFVAGLVDGLTWPRRPRVASWTRGGRPGDVAGPRKVWEPVFYMPARDLVDDDWPDDALDFHVRARTSDPGRVIGAKPSAFASWVFGLMGARAGDELVDLFPGSGGIARAWREASGIHAGDGSQDGVR